MKTLIITLVLLQGFFSQAQNAKIQEWHDKAESYSQWSVFLLNHTSLNRYSQISFKMSEEAVLKSICLGDNGGARITQLAFNVEGRVYIQTPLTIGASEDAQRRCFQVTIQRCFDELGKEALCIPGHYKEKFQAAGEAYLRASIAYRKLSNTALYLMKSPEERKKFNELVKQKLDRLHELALKYEAAQAKTHEAESTKILVLMILIGIAALAGLAFMGGGFMGILMLEIVETSIVLKTLGMISLVFGLSAGIWDMSANSILDVKSKDQIERQLGGLVYDQNRNIKTDQHLMAVVANALAENSHQQSLTLNKP